MNFATTAALAEIVGAQIVLRIDDDDAQRMRQAYVNDIFDSLRWLDLPWSVGPRSPSELPEWSQRSRRSHYERAMALLRQRGNAYVCACSRAEWGDFDGPGCPRDCQERELPLVSGESALRFDRDGMRDVVLWRRDDGPSYHLASVVDDDYFGVDLVVRGQDLRESTGIQKAISRCLPESRFHGAHVVHHALVTDSTGAKLSKSAGATSRPLERTEELREAITARSAALTQLLVADLPRSSGS